MKQQHQRWAPSVPGQLPGHVARMLPVIEAKAGATPREKALMTELAKSYKTRQLIPDLPPGEVDATLMNIHKQTTDAGLRVRIEWAYKRQAETERREARAAAH